MITTRVYICLLCFTSVVAVLSFIRTFAPILQGLLLTNWPKLPSGPVTRPPGARAASRLAVVDAVVGDPRILRCRPLAGRGPSDPSSVHPRQCAVRAGRFVRRVLGGLVLPRRVDVTPTVPPRYVS